MNAAAQSSMCSETHKTSDTTYKGVTPVYRNIAPSHQTANFVKIRAGVPFVRTSLYGAA